MTEARAPPGRTLLGGRRLRPPAPSGHLAAAEAAEAAAEAGGLGAAPGDVTQQGGRARR